MKIGLQTWGTEGDIRPFIALAEGLRDAGHRVTLSMSGLHPDRDQAMRVDGVETFWVGAEYFDNNHQAIGDLTVGIFKMASPLSQVRTVMEVFFCPIADDVYETSLRLCAENDAVIGHFMLYPLVVAARKEPTPHITVSLQSTMHPTDSAPPWVAPNLGPIVNRISWKLTSLGLDFALLPTFNAFMQKHGLPKAKTTRELMESRLLNLVGISPQLAPSPTGWEAHNKICGFFDRSDRNSSEPLSKDLEDFLSRGDRPVFLGFGSMVVDAVNDEEATDLMLETARRLDRRIIIQTPWKAAQALAGSDKIFVVDRVPHNLLFPRCALIAHHGGSGTSQSALNAGRPSVVVAHGGDQPIFGRILKQAGVCRHVLLKKYLTSKKLARAISKSLADPSLLPKAQSIGKKMRAEDGVAVAVEHIEEVVR